jgi:acetyl esterase/lipase
VEGRLMNPLRLLALPLCALLLTVAARADDSKKPAKEEKRFEVEVVKDVAYNDAKDADEKQKLDLYLPKGQKDFPVLFFVHGGTWKSGDRKQYEKLGKLYAERGLGMVVISYRLTPKVQHPAHIQDVAKAFSWTRANIGKHGGRADQIFCFGHSAGGHLVSLLATDESYLKAEKRSFADIKGVVSVSGVYTILPAGALANAFGKDPEVCKKASPIYNVSAKHPPFLILYGDADFLTLDWMAENMGKALEKAKCEVTTRKMDSRNHYTIMYNMLEDEDPTRTALLDFVKKHTEKK